MEINYEHRLTEVEQRSKSNKHRIDKLEKEHEALHSMAASMQVMVAEQKHQTEAINGVKDDVGRLEGKVDVLEGKPGKRWEAVVEKALLAVVAAVVAYFLGRMGL